MQSLDLISLLLIAIVGTTVGTALFERFLKSRRDNVTTEIGKIYKTSNLNRSTLPPCTLHS